MICQSAPPGSTRPASFSPRKLPPVIGITRRRPCAVSPSSCAGASVISALRSGWSVKRLEKPEKLAKGARRLAFLLLAPRVADERAQLLEVGARVIGHVVGERRVVGQQFLAQRFQAAMACGFRGGVAGERVELLAQRPRVDVAHQATDVLDLTTPALVRRDALRLEHGVAQLFGHAHVGEHRLGELDQLDAERLQVVHLFLALGFAERGDCAVLHLVIIAPPCRSATGSRSSKQSFATWRRACLRARGTAARAAPIARGRRPTASPSPCAKASPTPSSTTATAASA